MEAAKGGAGGGQSARRPGTAGGPEAQQRVGRPAVQPARVNSSNRATTATAEQEPAANQDRASKDDERETLQRAETDDRAMAGPSGPEDGRRGAGPVPVIPPEHPRHSGDDDVARRM